jgi:hypothetical protein
METMFADWLMAGTLSQSMYMPCVSSQDKCFSPLSSAPPFFRPSHPLPLHILPPFSPISVSQEGGARLADFRPKQQCSLVPGRAPRPEITHVKDMIGAAAVLPQQVRGRNGGPPRPCQPFGTHQ